MPRPRKRITADPFSEARAAINTALARGRATRETRERAQLINAAVLEYGKLLDDAVFAVTHGVAARTAVASMLERTELPAPGKTEAYLRNAVVARTDKEKLKLLAAKVRGHDVHGRPAPIWIHFLWLALREALGVEPTKDPLTLRRRLQQVREGHVS